MTPALLFSIIVPTELCSPRLLGRSQLGARASGRIRTESGRIRIQIRTKSGRNPDPKSACKILFSLLGSLKTLLRVMIGCQDLNAAA